MKLYDNNGYLDFRKIRDKGYPFNFIVGGRGTGKTYGALLSCVEDGETFILMRRTQAQVDIINTPEFSPMRPICRDTGRKITTKSVIKGIGGFFLYEDGDAGKVILHNPPLGYTCALSTIANVRGFDASHVTALLYDEFIPEKGERCLANEYDRLFNAYETMNRNRELDGGKPLQLFCLANANDLTSPVLVGLNLVKRVDRMAQSGQQLWTDDRRGILFCLLRDSPVSEMKRGTALYKLTAGTEFASMALDNDFAYEERGRIISRPLAEYKPLVRVGEITVYSHKSNGCYYVSTHNMGGCLAFDVGDTELSRFRQSYGWLWRELMADRIDFEDYVCQVLLQKYLG